MLFKQQFFRSFFEKRIHARASSSSSSSSSFEGCASGALRVAGDYELGGPVLSYLLAGRYSRLHFFFFIIFLFFVFGWETE